MSLFVHYIYLFVYLVCRKAPHPNGLSTLGRKTLINPYPISLASWHLWHAMAIDLSGAAAGRWPVRQGAQNQWLHFPNQKALSLSPFLMVCSLSFTI